MIVGSGMVANSFSKVPSKNMLFFFSGVSNSNEYREEEFEKEKRLLLSFSHLRKHVIYFSSYFVNFDHFLKNPYYKHKYDMEKLIYEKFHKYTIYRLPQVVGKSKNPNTLTNFIAKRVLNDETISIFKNAERNLIDIEDVVRVVTFINDNRWFVNEIVNLTATVNYSIDKIVDEIESVTMKKAKKKLVNYDHKKFPVILDNRIIEIYDILGIRFDLNYLKTLIGKYYGVN